MIYFQRSGPPHIGVTLYLSTTSVVHRGVPLRGCENPTYLFSAHFFLHAKKSNKKGRQVFFRASARGGYANGTIFQRQ